MNRTVRLVISAAVYSFILLFILSIVTRVIAEEIIKEMSSLCIFDGIVAMILPMIITFLIHFILKSVLNNYMSELFTTYSGFALTVIFTIALSFLFLDGQDTGRVSLIFTLVGLVITFVLMRRKHHDGKKSE